METLDDPRRIGEIRRVIARKPSLKSFYTGIYSRYMASLACCPPGLAVELGSGGGFAREIVPELITTDIVSYDGIVSVVDATRMPFQDGSVRFFGMLNVFHHIPDVAAFLREAERCLTPGGRLLLIDQHLGWISKPVLRYLHHEPFDPDRKEWSFESTGPLSGANGALAWIVFVRDRKRFEGEFQSLRVLRYQPFAPLAYWLAGGLKSWSVLPGKARGVMSVLDQLLLRVSVDSGSFVEIEIVKDTLLPRAR